MTPKPESIRVRPKDLAMIVGSIQLHAKRIELSANEND